MNRFANKVYLLTCGHIQHMYSWWWVGLSPETCRVKAFAKNKPQLLHLVGIIFTTKAWCTKPQILSKIIVMYMWTLMSLDRKREDHRLYRKAVCIPCVYFSFNSSKHAILICQGCTKIFKMFHIACLYVVTLPCLLFTRHEHVLSVSLFTAGLFS